MNTVPCPRCRTALIADSSTGEGPDRCPQCGVGVRLSVFPAAGSPRATATAGTAAVPGEAVCFYHESRRAVVPCDRCGRFLCALCDLAIADQVHVCPACLGAERRDAHSDLLETRRLRPDLVAGYLLLLGVLTCGVLLPLTGLAAILSLWRLRQAPGSLVEPSVNRIRLAYVGGALEILLGIALWVGAYFNSFSS